ncbi:VOC family protein [soil metagenome]
MFDHIGLGVSDYAASKSFFLAALAPLGVAIVMEGEHGLGIGQKGKPSLWLFQVDAFYAAAIAAGGQDNGEPGIRAHYHPNYYGAFVIGPDGHNVEAVCHRPEA